jgi:para-aminobenzoate synthetase component 1
LNWPPIPPGRMTPLADHKTLNYLYYFQAGALGAGEQRRRSGHVLNPDGTISETNTANLLVVSGKTVTRPGSSHVLPGVMQAAVCRRFHALGFSIKDRPLYPDAVLNADMVLLTNALMGAVPALSIDNQPLKCDNSLAASLNSNLFNQQQCKKSSLAHPHAWPGRHGPGGGKPRYDL